MKAHEELSAPLDLLACPVHGGPLSLTDSKAELVSSHGLRYPVVDGVPVLLRDDRPVTAPFMAESLAQAWRHVRGESALRAEEGAPLFLSSVGISDRQRRGVLDATAGGALDQGPVDPVAAHLVAATNGIAYLGAVGSLKRLPLPSPPLPPGSGQLALDVGCSWGRWSLALAQWGYRVVGVDPSLGAVMAGRRTAARLGVACSFVVGDARTLPFQSRAFDHVFSYSVIQHFSYDDAHAAIGEIGRVLRPGGRARVQMPNALGVRSLQHQVRRRFRAARGFEVRYWTLERLRAAFEGAIGQTDVSIDCFFGLGLQPTDVDLMSPLARAATWVSESLKGVARAYPRLPLHRIADSVYLDAIRAA